MIAFLKRLFCVHEPVWERNIYGDEINAVGGKRSWFRCRKCGKWFLMDEPVGEEHARIRWLIKRYEEQ